MANTLESIMRLTDDYTATMSKIVRSAQEGQKANENTEKSAKSLSETLRNISPSTSTAQTGVGALIGKLAALVSVAYVAKKAFDLLKESIQTAATQQIQKSTFQSLLGSAKLGNDLYEYVGAYAQKSALDRENLTSATTSFLAYTRNIDQLQQLLNLTQRLYLFNPAQGAEGAVFALKEALAGQNTSLKRRYNMVGISDETIEKNFDKGDTAATIKYLDQEFNKFGATQGVVDANFNSLSIQAALFKTNLMSAIGDQSNSAVSSLSQTFQRLNADMQAGKFQPFFDLMSKGTSDLANGLSWVAQNANTVAPIMAGAITAVIGFSIAMKAATLANLIFSASTAAVVGGALAVVAAVAAIGVGIATAKNMSDSMDKDTKQAQSLADAAMKYRKDQKDLGASTKGLSSGVTLPTTVNNKDPIKVSGTVEIEKENLKYMFDAATAKFFATFNATKVEPTLTIQHQEVTEKADVQEINQQLAAMLGEASGVTAGGNYA